MASPLDSLSPVVRVVTTTERAIQDRIKEYIDRYMQVSAITMSAVLSEEFPDKSIEEIDLIVDKFDLDFAEFLVWSQKNKGWLIELINKDEKVKEEIKEMLEKGFSKGQIVTKLKEKHGVPGVTIKRAIKVVETEMTEEAALRGAKEITVEELDKDIEAAASYILESQAKEEIKEDALEEEIITIDDGFGEEIEVVQLKLPEGLTTKGIYLDIEINGEYGGYRLLNDNGRKKICYGAYIFESLEEIEEYKAREIERLNKEFEELNKVWGIK